MHQFDSGRGLPKMKKTVLSLLIALLILGRIPKPAVAQTFNFERAYQDYLYSLSVYTQAYSDYERARDFYLTNQTLTLKEEARIKTLTMLKDRDQLETVYLTALRIRILEIMGLTTDEKNAIFGKIDSEVLWYKDHAGKYNDGDPLEDLFNKSSESESRYKTITTRIVYESLFTISIGEEKSLRLTHQEIYKTLRSIIEENVKAGKLDLNPFNRWFNDIDLVIANLTKNEDLAKTQIQKVYGESFSIQGSYNTAVATLASSTSLLSQLNSFLTEVATSIKNQL